MSKRSKQDVLADVGSLVQDGTLTFKELQDVYNFNAPESQQVTTSLANEKTAAPEGRAKNISNALYIVGTLIVSLGICLLIGQNWEQMTMPVRILVTLGLGIAVFAGGLSRSGRLPSPKINTDLLTGSLFTIASVALAVGAGVVVTEAGGELSEPGTTMVTAFVLGAVFLALYVAVVRSVVLLAAAIALAVGAYYAGIEWLTQDIAKPSEFYLFESAFVGVMLVAAGMAARTRTIASILSNLLYIVGTLLVLGSFFWMTLASDLLGGTNNTLLYDGIYPIVLACAVALSVYVNSRGILVMTAIFLTCYIFEISAEYFSDALGGSVALLLAGVLVIAMAYGATRFAKRYLR